MKQIFTYVLCALLTLPSVLCAEEIEIQLTDLFSINGQMVLKTLGEQINISFLPKGLYIIRAIAEDGKILQSKLIHE